APGQYGANIVAYDDRDDGRIAAANVVTEALQVGPHVFGVIPQVLDDRGILFDHIQAGDHGGRVGGRQAGAEKHGWGVMLNVRQHVVFTGEEDPHRGKALAERTHDHVHVVHHAEVGRRAAPVTEHAYTVRIVDHDPRTVFLANVDDLLEW